MDKLMKLAIVSELLSSHEGEGSEFKLDCIFSVN